MAYGDLRYLSGNRCSPRCRAAPGCAAVVIAATVSAQSWSDKRAMLVPVYPRSHVGTTVAASRHALGAPGARAALTPSRAGSNAGRRLEACHVSWHATLAPLAGACRKPGSHIGL